MRAAIAVSLVLSGLLSSQSNAKDVTAELASVWGRERLWFKECDDKAERYVDALVGVENNSDDTQAAAAASLAFDDAKLACDNTDAAWRKLVYPDTMSADLVGAFEDATSKCRKATRQRRVSFQTVLDWQNSENPPGDDEMQKANVAIADAHPIYLNCLKELKIFAARYGADL